MWGEDVSNAVTTIPAQPRVDQQITRLCQTFKDLKQTFVVSCRAEQLYLHTQQCIVTTVEDSFDLLGLVWRFGKLFCFSLGVF